MQREQKGVVTGVNLLKADLARKWAEKWTQPGAHKVPGNLNWGRELEGGWWLA